MKRMFAILLALCLFVAAAGCTSTTTPSPSGDQAVLNVWAIESPSVTDYATNGQSAWMEQQTGVSVNWMAVPSQGWFTAFQGSVMSGEAVDIYLYPFATTEVEMLGTQMSYIIPLEDLITPENTPNIHRILEANPELKDMITAPDGHIYTLFANDVYELAAYTQKLWVNRHFLEKYTAETGKGLPATTEEFENMLVYFNTHDMNGDGQQNEVPYIGVSGVDGMYNLFGSFIPANSSPNGFGCYVDQTNELTFSYNQEEYKDALAYIRNLYAQGLISPDNFTTSTEERYALTSGNRDAVRAGVVTGVNVRDVVQLSNEENTMNYDDYVALPPLAGPNGVRTIVSTGEVSVSLRNAITAQCKDPLTAIKWLDTGYSEVARTYAVYGGLEGVNWTYAEGKTLSGDGQIVTAIGDRRNNVCWGEQGIVYSITEADYMKMDASQIATNNALATYRANTLYRPYLVQNPWPSIVWAGEHTDVASDYSELNRLIQKEVTEYYTAVIIGEKNLESDWSTYVQALQEIGVSRYQELVQRYLNAGQ